MFGGNDGILGGMGHTRGASREVAGFRYVSLQHLFLCAHPRQEACADRLSRVSCDVWWGTVETDNPGSLRLLEKLGFEVKEIDPKNAWPEVKGGGFRECARLERKRMDGKK